jgi:hypothetical protein
LEEIEEWPDLVFGLGGMTHGRFSVDQVVVAPADATPVDDFCLDEVGDDPLCGPLGDPDLFSDVPQPDVDVLGDAEKNLRVVCQERPSRLPSA